MGKADGGLRNIFKDNIPHFQWTPIETGATISGVPDSEYCSPNGAQGWVEFKKTSGYAIGLSVFQISWIERRARAGGRVFIAVWRKGRELWILRPTIARVNSLRGLGENSPTVLLLASGEPAGWPWDRVAALLGP